MTWGSNPVGIVFVSIKLLGIWVLKGCLILIRLLFQMSVGILPLKVPSLITVFGSKSFLLNILVTQTFLVLLLPLLLHGFENALWKQKTWFWKGYVTLSQKITIILYGLTRKFQLSKVLNLKSLPLLLPRPNP